MTVRGVCRGRCDVSLERISATQTMLLTGFSFERPSDDHNIRRISVQLRPERGVAEVAFVDDGGLEIRSFSNDQGGLSVSTYRDTNREYVVTLQYVVVNLTRVREQRRISGGVSRRGTPWHPPVHQARVAVPVVDRPSEFGWSSQGVNTPPYALQGFEFGFTNSDHFLKEVGINLARAGEIVEFQDNDGGDGIAWSVDYAVLKRIGE